MKRLSQAPEFVLFLITVLIPIVFMSAVVVGIEQQSDNPSTKTWRLE